MRRAASTAPAATVRLERGRGNLGHREDAVAVQVLLHRQDDARAVRPAGDDDAELARERQSAARARSDAGRAPTRPRRARRDRRRAPGPCRRNRGARSSGCRAAAPRRAQRVCAADSITACGAQGTPQRRSGPSRRPGPGTPRPPPRPAPRAASARASRRAWAGTFSNSVVTASAHAASSARPAGSR